MNELQLASWLAAWVLLACVNVAYWKVPGWMIANGLLGVALFGGFHALTPEKVSLLEIAACSTWAAAFAVPLYFIRAFRTPGPLWLQAVAGAWAGLFFGLERGAWLVASSFGLGTIVLCIYAFAIRGRPEPRAGRERYAYALPLAVGSVIAALIF